MHLGEAGGQKRADKVAHRLGPEPLGEGSRTDDVAKQHRYLFHFGGKRCPGRCGRFGYEWPARNPFLQTRLVQRLAAVAAKPMFGRIARAARRTRDPQGRATLSAKFHPGEIVGAAPRAPHAEPPRGAGNRRLRFSSLVPSQSGGQHLASAGLPPNSPWKKVNAKARQHDRLLNGIKAQRSGHQLAALSLARHNLLAFLKWL